MNCTRIRLNRVVSMLTILSLSLMMYMVPPVYAEENFTGFSADVKRWAEECRKEILEQFDKLISSGQVTSTQLFDTFYIPIPNTYPQKYSTQYDTLFDQTIQLILDRYLLKDRRVLFVVIVDINGYLPTHNTVFSKPLTGNKEADSINNRTKRLFNDRTGLAAARNLDPLLLQKYNRDTGEVVYDLSVPIIFKNQHWGAVRIGYRE